MNKPIVRFDPYDYEIPLKASHDHESVNAFARRKLEEFARAFEDFRELERRAQRGSREKFEAAMAKVPKTPPAPGDEVQGQSSRHGGACFLGRGVR